jgi:hypothetical protein
VRFQPFTCLSDGLGWFECGCDGDVIVDRCLIEFKTVVSPGTLQRIWFDQMLGYVLLDYDDAHGIEGIGIYLTRQAELRQWSLAEIMGTLCATPKPSLSNLRAGFREVVGLTRRPHRPGTEVPRTAR